MIYYLNEKHDNPWNETKFNFKGAADKVGFKIDHEAVLRKDFSQEVLSKLFLEMAG